MSFDKIIEAFHPDFVLLAIQIGSMICVVAVVIRQLLFRFNKAPNKTAKIKDQTKELLATRIAKRTEVATMRGQVKAKKYRLELLAQEHAMRTGGALKAGQSARPSSSVQTAQTPPAQSPPAQSVIASTS